MTAREEAEQALTAYYGYYGPDEPPGSAAPHLAAEVLDAYRAEVLREAAEILAPRWVDGGAGALLRHMADKSLLMCSACSGCGHEVTETEDGADVRRCRACNGSGLVAAAGGESS